MTATTPTEGTASAAPAARSQIGVVIVAHDREALVERAVHSVYRQDLEGLGNGIIGKGIVEVCLVDAASTDGTLGVLERLAGEAPAGFHVRVAQEASGGASRARNLGWESLSAPVIAFLDDDAVADCRWLATAWASLSADENIDALGGKTTLSWLGEPPASMLAESAATFMGLDYGPERRRIRFPLAPIGPNMIVRRRALEAVGGFDPDLGPAPGRARVCEEGDLALRIERAGGRIVYEPAVGVAHLIDPGRITSEYLLTRARIHGHSLALVDRKHFGWRRAPRQIVRLRKSVWRVLWRRRVTVCEQSDFVFALAYFRTLIRGETEV